MTDDPGPSILALDRQQGKTTTVIDEIVAYLDESLAHRAAVICPAHNECERIADELRRRDVEPHRLRYVTAGRDGAVRARGISGEYAVWAENLDRWEHGIYDPTLRILWDQVQTVTCTPDPRHAFTDRSVLTDGPLRFEDSHQEVAHRS